MAATSRDGAVVGLCLMAMLALGSIGADAQIISTNLTTEFYDETCPQLYDIVKAGVKARVTNNSRNAASIIRLHFHDCFVNGCDGSLLLDNTTDFTSEQYARANNDSIRELGAIEDIKAQLEAVCPLTVSCADILALASRDAAVEVGLSPGYAVFFGRRDSLTASIAQANLSLPSPFFDYPSLVNNFKAVGLDEVDLVTLSGAHTVGRVHCSVILNNQTALNTTSGFDPVFLANNVASCGNDSEKLLNLDETTPDFFDNWYYKNLLEGQGALVTDNVLFHTAGGISQPLVAKYAFDSAAFAEQYAVSTIKMGNISPLLGDEGEIRLNCSVPNSANPLWWSTRASRIASQ